MAALRRGIVVVGTLRMAVCTLILILLWFTAAGAGGTVTVTTDRFGEQTAEFVVWLVVTPVMTLALYYAVERELVSGE